MITRRIIPNDPMVRVLRNNNYIAYYVDGKWSMADSDYTKVNKVYSKKKR
jgi:hypothetical protein